MKSKIKAIPGVFPINVFRAVKVGDGTATSLEDVFPFMMNYGDCVKGINHRGYCITAPENTISAFKLSKKNGFKYVEADVMVTSDGIPVLSHDETIDRCSNGTGTIASMTFEELRTYDFGSWKSAQYEGEKIPSLEEFMSLCKALGLHPYLEVKGYGTYGDDGVATMMNIVRSYGMLDKVTWISFSSDALTYIANNDPNARLGYICDITEDTIATATTLKGDRSGEVFLDVSVANLTSDKLTMMKTSGFSLEVWTVNSSNDMLDLDPYCSGVTSNNYNYAKVLFDNCIN